MQESQPLANSLGLHRAIFFNGNEGRLENFRPYALPDETWLEEVGKTGRADGLATPRRKNS
jgi:hypothetical protein